MKKLRIILNIIAYLMIINWSVFIQKTESVYHENLHKYKINPTNSNFNLIKAINNATIIDLIFNMKDV